MPLILRKIEKGRWNSDPQAVPWLPPGEVQAQALLDLAPKDNGLSVWLIEEDRSNLDRVVAALAGVLRTGERKRRSNREVGVLLANAVRQGRIDGLEGGLQAKIDRLLSRS